MAEEQTDIRRELLGVLLRKVEQDHYPSTTMMDLIEELVTPEERPAYARILLEKLQGDEFPSLDLMHRVRSLG